MKREWQSILDDMAKMASGAVSLAEGMRQEAADKWRAKMEQNIKKLDLVTREEFKALAAMVSKFRAEQERLSAELQQLKGARPKKPAAVKSGKVAQRKAKIKKAKRAA